MLQAFLAYFALAILLKIPQLAHVVCHHIILNFCIYILWSAVLYTVEFQKRGLPHLHTLLWVSSTTKIQNAEDVDRYISAELPNPVADPRAYKIVSEMMMHGPCGKANMNAPCMDGEVCTKKFPKKYNNDTFFDDKGRVHYRRRQTNIFAAKLLMLGV